MSDFENFSKQKIGLEELPSNYKSRDGLVFDPRQDEWKIGWIQTGAKISFTGIKPLLSNRLFISLKYVLMMFSGVKSPDHTRNSLHRIYKLVRHAHSNTPIESITSSQIFAYKATLSSKKENDLGGLRSFLLYWIKTGTHGVEKSAGEVLQKMRLKGNEKGRAVLQLDPFEGPFSNSEFEMITNSISDFIEQGRLQMKEAAAVLLMMSLGCRRIQLASLKICDLQAYGTQSGLFLYRLNLPLAKKRYTSIRTEFDPIPLSPLLAHTLKECIQEQSHFWKGVDIEESDRPIFVNEKNPETGYHYDSLEFGQFVTRILKTLELFSSRTGAPMKYTVSRFRRTLGTRAAAEGADELRLAKLLGHSDTQNVGIYVQASDKMFQRINKQMAVYFGPIVKAFRGELPAKKDRDITLRSIISTDANLASPLGKCQKNRDCQLLSPVACYTCRKFNPFIEGPHEEVLGSLIAERDRIWDETKDQTMAEVNDLAILACAEVLAMCQQKQPQGNEHVC